MSSPSRVSTAGSTKDASSSSRSKTPSKQSSTGAGTGTGTGTGKKLTKEQVAAKKKTEEAKKAAIEAKAKAAEEALVARKEKWDFVMKDRVEKRQAIVEETAAHDVSLTSLNEKIELLTTSSETSIDSYQKKYTDLQLEIEKLVAELKADDEIVTEEKGGLGSMLGGMLGGGSGGGDGDGGNKKEKMLHE